MLQMFSILTYRLTSCKHRTDTSFDCSIRSSISAAIFFGSVVFFASIICNAKGLPFPRHLTSMSSRPLPINIIFSLCTSKSTPKNGHISRDITSWILSSFIRLPFRIHGVWLRLRDNFRYLPATNTVGPFTVYRANLTGIDAVFDGTGICFLHSSRSRFLGK